MVVKGPLSVYLPAAYPTGLRAAQRTSRNGETVTCRKQSPLHSGYFSFSFIEVLTVL